MNKHFNFGAAMLLGGTALAGLGVRPAFADTINIQVYAAFAPNHNGSPSYAGWAANAVSAVENNDTSFGSPTSPTYFQEVTGPASSSQNVVTNFNSWNGVANPGGAYASEEGNRLTYIAVVTDTTGPGISLSGLGETITAGPNPTGGGQAGSLNLSYNWGTGNLAYYTFFNGSPQSFSTGTPTYGPTAIGLNGSGQQITSTGESGSDLVNELIVVGWGNALANTASSSPACAALGSTQAAISCVEHNYASIAPLDMTGAFTYGASSGSDSVNFGPVNTPEPATLALFGSAIASLGLVGRKRKKV